MILRAVVLLAVVGIAACDSRTLSDSPSVTPSAPSALPSSLTSSAGAVTGRSAQGRDAVPVNMQDACDPDTFNAALGAGTCVRSGGVKFDDFIDTLTRLGFVGPWHFAPNNAHAPAGATFVATNRGGEVHTFTEVAQFGGGIVPSLNQLSRETTVAPECTSLDPDDFVAPGASYEERVDEAGTVKFQCCIHPWMRLEAQVTAK
jgi:hypothetical protein